MNVDPSGEIQSASVVLRGVSRAFHDVKAVRDVSLHIEAGSFFSLLGPSGCGKSTTLRMIAGFEHPDTGTISIGGVDVTNVPPQKRPTAMVFQNYALFPHMTVAQNVEYGLAVKGMNAGDRKKRALEALDRVEMASLYEKSVTELSGGQQQRIALARALATQPDVLLFDEPLSNLDAELREQTRLELKRMQKELGTTSIYVTHDQEEALALSDRMAIMKDGRIVQTGAPRDVYYNPASAFSARFLGGSNLIEGDCAELLAGESHAEKSRSAGSQAEERHSERSHIEGMVLAVRAEDVQPDPDGTFEGELVFQQFLGRSSELLIQWKGIQLKSSARGEALQNGPIRFNVVGSSWVTDDR
ncbi:MAG: ABC transporter ATP-binding protein [Bacteroidetes bacterium]|nr:MAG: ABC transporter ATP-binding protein [Bacteroidota bacterium]